MIDEGRDGAALELEAGAVVKRAAAAGDGIMGEGGDIGGPDLQVFVKVFRPVDFQARCVSGNGNNRRIGFFQPIEDHAIFEGVFLLGIVSEAAVGTGDAAVERDGAGGVGYHREGDQFRVVGGGADFIAQVDR